jgi:hypothetical protein
LSRRRARLLVPLAVCALALTAVPAPAAAPAASALTLRLVDLPPGYGTPFGRCDDSPPLGDVVPLVRACKIEFVRYWTAPGATPGPAVVTSAAIVFTSAQRAESALDDPLNAASLAFDPASDDFEVAGPAPAIGDEAVLLRASDGRVVVVWRSGPVLATLLVGNGFVRRPVDLQTALALAAKQQARIAAPTPLPPTDDGSEVALDDPGLDLPVWWLGRELPRRGALPGLRFAGSVPGDLFGSDRHDLGPMLFYGRRDSRADVVLQLARPSLLHRPAMRRELRRMRQDRCNLLRRVTLRDGRATIFQRSPRCPKLDVRKTADALADSTAVVVLPGLVALVLADGCVSCRGPVSRYESIAGMRRIARALRPREPRGLTTP